jgi:hypothetical protein
MTTQFVGEVYKVERSTGLIERTAEAKWFSYHATLEGAKTEALSDFQYHYDNGRMEWVIFDNRTWKAVCNRDYVWYRIVQIAIRA